MKEKSTGDALLEKKRLEKRSEEYRAMYKKMAQDRASEMGEVVAVTDGSKDDADPDNLYPGKSTWQLDMRRRTP